jgi:hypothetical protein
MLTMTNAYFCRPEQPVTIFWVVAGGAADTVPGTDANSRR